MGPRISVTHPQEVQEDTGWQGAHPHLHVLRMAEQIQGPVVGLVGLQGTQLEPNSD